MQRATTHIPKNLHSSVCVWPFRLEELWRNARKARGQILPSGNPASLPFIGWETPSAVECESRVWRTLQQPFDLYGVNRLRYCAVRFGETICNNAICSLRLGELTREWYGRLQRLTIQKYKWRLCFWNSSPNLKQKCQCLASHSSKWSETRPTQKRSKREGRSVDLTGADKPHLALFYDVKGKEVN